MQQSQFFPVYSRSFDTPLNKKPQQNPIHVYVGYHIRRQELSIGGA
jgi:hypothetical protein